MTERETRNGPAILYMAIAMTAFGVADTLIRVAMTWTGGGASPGQTIFMLGLVGLIVTSLMLWREGDGLPRKTVLDRRVQWRTMIEFAGMAAMITALSMIEVSTVAAIVQFQPILVALGAALFLGERVGPLRMIAIAIGFVGVLIIIRPGSGSVGPEVAILGITVVALAGRDLLTRAIGRDHSIAAMSVLVMIGMLPLGLLLDAGLGQWGTLSPHVLGILVLAGSFGMTGYYFVTLASRIGEASAISPFRYLRLPAAFTAAAILLGERPDLATWIGSALVIAPGIFIWLRERRARSSVRPT